MSSGTIYEKLAAGQLAFTAAVRVSDWEVERPLWPLDSTHVVVSARFWQKRASYTTPAANTALGGSEYATAVFVGDSQLRDLRAGMCEFTRTYATVPASYDDFESYAFQFPGFDSIAVQARDPFSVTTTSKRAYDYFLVGSGETYASASAIPVVYNNLPDVNYLTDDTTPTAESYLTWKADDITTPTSYSVRPVDSELKRYRGNIWQRMTRYVKAR